MGHVYLDFHDIDIEAKNVMVAMIGGPSISGESSWMHMKTLLHAVVWTWLAGHCSYPYQTHDTCGMVFDDLQ
jgi:hypothetical protein